MRTEPRALGFIPSTKIRQRYVATERYAIIKDGQGVPRGYLIWGPIRSGAPVFLTQVCTEFDHRLCGVAHEALERLLTVARRAGCPGVHLRCAVDLAANAFWLAEGFRLQAILSGDNQTGRMIAVYWRSLEMCRSNHTSLLARMRLGRSCATTQ